MEDEVGQASVGGIGGGAAGDGWAPAVAPLLGLARAGRRRRGEENGGEWERIRFRWSR